MSVKLSLNGTSQGFSKCCSHFCRRNKQWVLSIPIPGVGQTMACEPNPTNCVGKKKFYGSTAPPIHLHVYVYVSAVLLRWQNRGDAYGLQRQRFTIRLFTEKSCPPRPCSNDIRYWHKDNGSPYFLFLWFSVFCVYLLLFGYIYFLPCTGLGVPGMNMGICFQKLPFFFPSSFFSRFIAPS